MNESKPTHKNTGVPHEATSPLDLSSLPPEATTQHFPERHEAVHLSSDPAWIFGNRWATDPNYAGRGWTDIESNLRNSWEAGNSGSWDVYRDRVRKGFEGKSEGEEDALATPDLSARSGQRGY